MQANKRAKAPLAFRKRRYSRPELVSHDRGCLEEKRLALNRAVNAVQSRQHKRGNSKPVLSGLPK
jgi:hypothetical protein